ncbi:galactonate dehydratase [Angulomicrobium tetraedrale]|uniref:Galactonate dehydratase n=1 Tax=Ancylobacter tetraedralis TaxID=217068 RepID=A0A839Z2Z6_9HYPH|nr:galactonate dehydratase [Ancylobacter tetraedralis]
MSGKKEKVVDGYLQSIAPLIVGRDVFHLRHLGQVLLDDFAIRRSSVDFLAAWSAIEIASWDIIGKAAGLPVHKLLGGAVREKIRVYANGWWFGAKGVDETVSRAVEVVRQGYDAIKWDPIPGPWRNFISRADENEAVAHVKAMREAVGPNVELLVDGHRRLAPVHAIRLAERFAEYDIGWYEEPCPPDNIDLTAQVKRSTHIPIVVGEAIYTKEGFLPVFQKQAADIINPDICAVGGLSAMLDIATLAAPHAVGVSPHNFNSPIVGLAATVQLSALITNFTIAELFVNLIEPTRPITAQGLNIEAGWVDLPTTPGLGIDLDREELLKRPYAELPGKNLRHYWEEFPRKGAVSAQPFTLPA